MCFVRTTSMTSERLKIPYKIIKGKCQNKIICQVLSKSQAESNVQKKDKHTKQKTSLGNETKQKGLLNNTNKAEKTSVQRNARNKAC